VNGTGGIQKVRDQEDFLGFLVSCLKIFRMGGRSPNYFNVILPRFGRRRLELAAYPGFRLAPTLHCTVERPDHCLPLLSRSPQLADCRSACKGNRLSLNLR
jgi:hypothetical protein